MALSDGNIDIHVYTTEKFVHVSERIAAATGQYNSLARGRYRQEKWKTWTFGEEEKENAAIAVVGPAAPEGQRRDEIDMYSALPPIYRRGQAGGILSARYIYERQTSISCEHTALRTPACVGVGARARAES